MDVIPAPANQTVSPQCVHFSIVRSDLRLTPTVAASANANIAHHQRTAYACMGPIGITLMAAEYVPVSLVSLKRLKYEKKIKIHYYHEQMYIL
ncbi:antistasin [Biomphalaria pfeifferi]|uniref:Antistasin n=1 Tax=Biomphalaria pfeifferi TaxID=112525 RepID=A0AAD8F0L2_BIOPF|nr:antistasin [Biomphalaria pfeifferi]